MRCAIFLRIALIGSIVMLLPDGNASAVGEGAGARAGTGASAGRSARTGEGDGGVGEEGIEDCFEGAGAGVAGRGAGATATTAPGLARYASMSAFVTRPEMPVPVICEM